MTPTARRARTRRAALHAATLASLTVLAAALALSAASCNSLSPTRPQPTTGPSVSEGAPVMRVRLGNSRESAEFSSDGVIELLVLGPTGASLRTRAGESVAVSHGELGWTARHNNTERRLGAGTLSVRPTGSQPIRFANGLHEGEFTLFPRADRSPGVFDVVERVPMEVYIAGVIAKELYPNWSPAAFEAQAIAARSYAMHERQRQIVAKREWDIESTDSDQVYAGVAINPTALRAAQNTAGRVLHFNGRLLRAYYSSTCGGRANSARDIWPTGPGFEFNLVAPIQASERVCACDASPLHRWTVKRTKDDVVKRVGAYGAAQGMAVRSITSIKSITPERSNAVDRPTRFRVTDEQGKWWSMTAEDMRRALNAAAPGLPAITRDVRVHSADFEAKFTPTGAEFIGRGFGHGVGMCQFGAQGFALRGESADQILRRFYPGATLANAY